MVTYLNLGEEKFVQGAAHILKAGYVMTIDYGSNWDGVITQDRAHLRTYGPEHQLQNDHVEPFEANLADDGTPQEIDTSDPYKGPTLNDITTDVNFSLMAAEGQLAGLSTVYFGAQKALASGTKVSLDVVPEYRRKHDDLIQEYESWLKDFKNGDTFKLLVQYGLGLCLPGPDARTSNVERERSDTGAARRSRGDRKSAGGSITTWLAEPAKGERPNGRSHLF